MFTKPFSIKKIFLIFILVFSLAIFLWFCYLQTSWSQRRYHRAGSRGVEWILKHSQEMSPRDVVAYLMGIYKVVDDERLAQKIYQVIEQERKRILPVATYVDLSVKQLDWNRDIAPVAEEIARLKCKGESMVEETRALTEILYKNKQAIFPIKISEADKYIIDYDLWEIGIATNDFYARPVISERKLEPVNKGQLSSSDREWLYGLTHSVIVPTGYYDGYLDPKLYPEQIGLLRSVVETSGLSLDNDNTIDILAQSVVSLKLLSQEDDSRVRNIKNQLIKAQNADGSWGANDTISSQKIHETTMAIMALLDFSLQFKPDKVFCY